jgi:plastocyanin
MSMNVHSLLSCGRRPKAVVVAAGLVTLSLVFALFVAACGSGSGGSTNTSAPGEGTTIAAENGVQVIMTNRTFDPHTVTIQVGQTVTWVNQDAPQHDVVADNGEFQSQLFDKGQTFSFSFTKAGTFPYRQ